MPAISAARLSCVSPQAPRVCGLRRAVTRVAVSRRNVSPVSCTARTWERRSVAIATRSFSTSLSRLSKRSKPFTDRSHQQLGRLEPGLRLRVCGSGLPVQRLGRHDLELVEHGLPVGGDLLRSLDRRMPLGERLAPSLLTTSAASTWAAAASALASAVSLRASATLARKCAAS